MSWREGTPADRGPELVGCSIKVWWDNEQGGDFYEGKVSAYDQMNDVFQVIYGTDSNPYDEKLDETWQIFDFVGRRLTRERERVKLAGPEAVGKPLIQEEPEPTPAPPPPPGRWKFTGKATYTDMIIEAIKDLADKNGSSLPAIRKWICTNVPDASKKQKVSFNNLTKKAILKLEAEDVLARNKSSFRFTPTFLYRQRQMDQARSAALAAQAYGGGSSSTIKVGAHGDFSNYPLPYAGGSSSRKSKGSYTDASAILLQNADMRKEWELANERRKAYLLKYRPFIEPFLQEDSNFYVKMEAEELFQKEDLQRRRREEKVKRHEQEMREKEAKMSQHIENDRIKMMKAALEPFRDELTKHATAVAAASAASGAGRGAMNFMNGGEYGAAYHHQAAAAAQQQQALAAPSYLPQPRPQHSNVASMLLEASRALEDQGPITVHGQLPAFHLLNLDCRNLPLDGGPELREIMLRMGWISERELTASVRVPLGITGKPVDPACILPPLEMASDGTLLMEDKMLIGHVLNDGPYEGHFVVWPGSRIPVDNMPKDSEKDLLNQVLGWQQLYWLQKRVDPTAAKAGRREPNVVALRLRDGRFVTHKYAMMRCTQKYAETRRIPLNNQITIHYRCPYTGQHMRSMRDYCWVSRYAEAVRRCLKTRVEKDVGTFQQLQDMIDAYSPESVARPWRTALVGGQLGGRLVVAPEIKQQQEEEEHQEQQKIQSPPAPSSPSSIASAVTTGGHQAPPPTPTTTAPSQQYQQQQQQKQKAKSPKIQPPAQQPQGEAFQQMLAAQHQPPPQHHPYMHYQQEAAAAAAYPYAPMGGYGMHYSHQQAQYQPQMDAPQQYAPVHPYYAAKGFVPQPPPPPSPVAGPPIDPVVRERARWVECVMKPVKAEGLLQATQSYQFFLEDGKNQPEALLRPIRQAFENATSMHLHLQQQKAAAVKAEEAKLKAAPLKAAASEASSSCKKMEEMEGGRGEHKEGENGVTAAKKEEVGEGKIEPVVALDPIDPLENVPVVQASRTIIPKLHDHQVSGLSWLVNMYRHAVPAILGDQMGLGKTLQSIAFLAYLKDNLKVPGPHLVVVPLSVMSNWIQEIERFCPSMRYVRFHGPKAERARIKSEELSDTREFDLVITTYEMFTSEVSFFRRHFFWRVVIVDEGHRLKNEKSQLSECLRKVPAFWRLILTGTPCQNNLRELWALFHYLLPDVFTPSTAEKFEEGFDALRSKMDMDRLKQARALLSLLMLRRRKDQISMTLPSKTELAVVCGLSETQRAWYKRILTGVRGQLLSPFKGESEMPDIEWRKLLNLLLQLRKVCNHPYLMTASEYLPGEQMVEASGKLKVLDRMLPKLKEDGHRVLLFSQFTSMLDILEDFCQMRGYEYVRLDGSTNRVQRRLDLRRYNAAGSPIFIFLISTRAGGQGINLATADTVILYDSDWNPQVDLQAMERCHRIGQTKPVRVYRLVVRASVEERMVSRAHKKLFLNEMVAEKPTTRAVSALEDLGDGEEELVSEDGKAGEEDPIAEMGSVGGSNAALAKDEVARLIRTGVTALFAGKGGSGDVTDEELDVLLGRKEGKVSEPGAVEEEDEGAVASFWQQSSAEMELQEVDVRHLEGVNYEKESKRAWEALPENSGASLADLDLGVRKRKQRMIMIDGKGTGYGGSIPVLAEDYERQQAEQAAEAAAANGGGGGGSSSSAAEAAAPRRARREWEYEGDCFLCHQALDESTPKDNFKCGHCPKIYHCSCLTDFMGSCVEGVGPALTMICPQHKCINCQRNTAAAGGLLFRCVDCPRSFCEDCLEDELIESLGRWKPLENLGYFSRQAYYIRCPTCVTVARGDDAGAVGGEEEEESGSGDGEMEEGMDGEEEEEDGGAMDDGGMEEEEDDVIQV